MTDIRQCGANPNFWWPVAHQRTFRPNELNPARLGPVEVIVLRDSNGHIRVYEDACPHKRVRLSVFGKKSGDSIACGYHGWRFASDTGTATLPCMRPSDTGTATLPCMRPNAQAVMEPRSLCLREFPVRQYGGWIWAFLGDASLADATPLPSVPPAESADYHAVPMQGLVRCHYSIMTENATDLFHAALHQTMQPWANPELLSIKNNDEEVQAVYEVDTPRLLAALISSKGRHTITVTYRYPYFHLTSDDGAFYLFVVYVPQTLQTTWVHSTFYFRHVWNMPWILRTLDPFLNHGTFRVVFEQDMDAVEEEQRAYNLYERDLSRETNPVTHAVRRVIARQTVGQLSVPPCTEFVPRTII